MLFGLHEYMTLVHALVRLATPFAPISAYSTTFELKYALNLTKATRLLSMKSSSQRFLPGATELGIDPNHIYFIKGNSKCRKSFWSIIENVRRNKISRVDPRTATKIPWPISYFPAEQVGSPKGDESISSFSISV